MYGGHQGNSQMATQMGRQQQQHVVPGNQQNAGQVVVHNFNNHNGQSASVYYQRPTQNTMTSQQQHMTSQMNGMTSPVTQVVGRTQMGGAVPRGNQATMMVGGNHVNGSHMVHSNGQMVQSGGQMVAGNHGNQMGGQMIHHNGRGLKT